MSDERLDEATSRRLARLGTMPVDTSHLDKALRRAISQPGRSVIGWIWPLRAVAASFIVLLLIAAIILGTGSRPVLASPAQMAQMHEELVSGKAPVTQVDSIQEANKVLASQSPTSPQLPQPPTDHVMACCMKSVRNKKVACVLLKSEGVPITMAVANAADMRLPAAPTVMRDGVAYRVQSVGDLNMVLTQRQGRWLCLMGRLPQERLMQIASELRF